MEKISSTLDYSSFAVESRLDFEKKMDTLALADKVIFVASLSRSPEIQAQLTPLLINKFIQEVRFSEEDVVSPVVGILNNCSLAEKLERIQVVKTIAISAASTKLHTEDLARQLLEALQLMERYVEHPFGKVMAEAAAEQALKSFSTDTVGENFERPEDWGKSPDFLVKKDAVLLEKYQFVPPLAESDFPALLSTDVMGILDQSGGLQKFGFLVDGEAGVVNLRPAVEMVETEQVLPFQLASDHRVSSVLIQQMQHPRVRQYIEDHLNIALVDLPMRGQFQLLEFLLENDKQAFSGLELAMARINLDTLNLAKTFLAGSADKKIINQVIEFARVAPVEVVNKVTEIYAQVTDQIDLVEAQAREYFVASKRIDSRKVVQEIVKRANQILVDTIAQPDEQALSRLASLKHDVIFFASLFKTARAEIKNFTEVVGLDYQTMPGSELSAEQKQQIIELSKYNYQAVQPEVVERLRKLLEDKNQLSKNEFILLSQKLPTESRLLACLRVESRGPDRVYVGAFNVRAEAHGAGIGERMLESTVKELAKTKTIEAIMVAELQAGTHYVEQMGAVATRFIAYEDNPGSQGHFDIVVEKTPLPSMLRGLPKETLRKLYEQEFKNKDPLAQIGEPIILAEFDTATEMAEIAAVSESLLNEHDYRLTRYIGLNAAGIRRLYGFEQVNTGPATT